MSHLQVTTIWCNFKSIRKARISKFAHKATLALTLNSLAMVEPHRDQQPYQLSTEDIWFVDNQLFQNRRRVFPFFERWPGELLVQPAQCTNLQQCTFDKFYIQTRMLFYHRTSMREFLMSSRNCPVDSLNSEVRCRKSQNRTFGHTPVQHCWTSLCPALSIMRTPQCGLHMTLRDIGVNFEVHDRMASGSLRRLDGLPSKVYSRTFYTLYRKAIDWL